MNTIRKTLASVSAVAIGSLIIFGSGAGPAQAAEVPSPTILSQPQNQTVVEGQTATFNVVADDTTTGYQWYTGATSTLDDSWTPVSGATAATLSVPNTTLRMNGTRYAVVVAGPEAGTVSSTAQLTVSTVGGTPPPGVVGIPYSFSFPLGRSVAGVNLSSGALPPGLFLAPSNGFLGGTPLVAGSFNFALTTVGPEGTSAPYPVTMTVGSLPVVTQQPTDQTVPLGSVAAFTATATGDPAPTIQWQKSPVGFDANSWTNIPGATQTTLTFDNVQTSVFGFYRAVFSNSAGSATTNYVELKGTIPIIGQPADVTVNAGQDATFSVRTNGTPTIQWQVSADAGNTWTNLPGATSSTLTLTGVGAELNGNRYRAVVTNPVNSVNYSDSAKLTVAGVPPVFTSSSPLPAASYNTPYTFTVTASGDPAAAIALTAGSLPAGLSLNNGVISGTPTALGTSSFTLTASNTAGAVNLNASITVNLRADGQSVAPGVGVLSSDNANDGLLGSDYNITINMWWGGNGQLFQLYENGNLVATVPLTTNGLNAQTATVHLTGRGNGNYVYTGKLVSSKGTTPTASLNAKIDAANPGVGVLSNDNWDNDGNFVVTDNLWWGTNATSYTVYQNDVAVASGPVTANTPNAQTVKYTASGLAKGNYSYKVKLSNALGDTFSHTMTVKVTK